MIDVKLDTRDHRDVIKHTRYERNKSLSNKEGTAQSYSVAKELGTVQNKNSDKDGQDESVIVTVRDMDKINNQTS